MIGLATILLGFGQIDDAKLAAQRRGDGPVFPVIFRGRWASEPSECGDENLFHNVITANQVHGYEAHGRLLRISAMRQHRTPAGERAQTVIAVIAWTVEGEDSTGRLRLSRVGNWLVKSNANEVTEAEHWALVNIRCPGG